MGLNFIRFAGPHLNSMNVAIYGRGEGGYRLIAETNDERIEGSVAVDMTVGELNELLDGNPYDDLADTIAALERCGVSVNSEEPTSDYRPSPLRKYVKPWLISQATKGVPK